MLRKRFGERRVGHAGTLDPDATGVLVVGVGNATRLLRFVTDSGKSYDGEVGARRRDRPLDAAGDGDRHPRHGRRRRRPSAGGRRRAPRSATSSRFRRWCRRSRSAAGGCTSSLVTESRSSERRVPVTVHRVRRRRPTDDPLVYRIEVDCSSGTYIRTLAADLGRLLGGGAHLRHLRRTAVGSFTLDMAAPPDECELLPVAAAVALPRSGDRRRADRRPGRHRCRAARVGRATGRGECR